MNVDNLIAQTPIKTDIEREQELEWFLQCNLKHTYKDPSPSQLLEIFPQAISIIKRNLKEYKKEYEEIEKQLSASLDPLFEEVYAHTDISDEEKKIKVNVIVEQFYKKPLQYRKTIIQKLQLFLRIHAMKEMEKRGILPDNSQRITEDDILHAKEYPIGDLIEINRSGFTRCLFHEERTASCKVYEDQNKFHCFGCGKDGDAIDLACKIYGYEFIEAVKFLIKK